MGEQITGKKGSSFLYGAIIVLAIIALGFFALRGGSDSKRTDVQVSEKDIIIGEKNAAITIVEFTDFSCPYCAAAEGKNIEAINYLKSNDASWQSPIPNIYENYVKTGKARIVVKYYPGHGQGQEAHRVGWCLYEQIPERFDDYKKKVFADQENANNIELMKEYAVSAGADKEKINQCLASKRYEGNFNSQMLDGMNAGVKGTPTFFVNGLKIEGAASYSEFQKIIESELSQ